MDVCIDWRRGRGDPISKKYKLVLQLIANPWHIRFLSYIRCLVLMTVLCFFHCLIHSLGCSRSFWKHQSRHLRKEQIAFGWDNYAGICTLAEPSISNFSTHRTWNILAWKCSNSKFNQISGTLEDVKSSSIAHSIASRRTHILEFVSGSLYCKLRHSKIYYSGSVSGHKTN
jgi:hypothetical protein